MAVPHGLLGRQRLQADFGVFFTREELEAGTAEYNYTRQVFPLSDAPGVSVFVRADDGRVYHTYSTYSRGLDALNTAYQYLDLVPRGRNEDGLPSPSAWVRYRDEYPRPLRLD